MGKGCATGMARLLSPRMCATSEVPRGLVRGFLGAVPRPAVCRFIVVRLPLYGSLQPTRQSEAMDLA